MITLEQAKQLKQGDILYHVTNRYTDGTAQRWRVTSVKTWKTQPDIVLVRAKHGLYVYSNINHDKLHLVCLTDPTLSPEDNFQTHPEPVDDIN